MTTKKVSELERGDHIGWRHHDECHGGVIQTIERDAQLTHCTFESKGKGAWCFSNDDELKIVE